MGAAIDIGDKKSVNVELNIVPYIDLMSCLTAFLLVAAVWVNIAQITIQPKGKNRNKPDIDPIQNNPMISILIQSDVMYIGVARSADFEPVKVPRETGNFNWEQLKTTLV